MLKRSIAILGIALFSGCAAQLSVLTEEVHYIQPGDFVGELGTEHVEDVDAPVMAELDVQEELEVESIRIEDVLAEIEEFDEAMMPNAVGIPLTVEALVGQVNGRPVYANKVLEPIADQITAIAGNVSRSEFSDMTRNYLYSEEDQMGITVRGGRLYEMVITDLLLSEALSGMSEEQSYGLLSIVGQMRDDLVSSQGGSQTQLRQILAEQSGLSVEKFLELQRDQILIDALYRQKIWPKINITWRDIQREFEQVSLGEPVLFQEGDDERTDTVVAALRGNPPVALGNIEAAHGTVTLGMIRLPMEDPEVELVQEAFADGSSFQEVAEMLELEKGGIWRTFKMGLDGVEDIKVGEKIKSHLVGVGEGDIPEPFEFGSDYMWVAVLEVQQPISLYNPRVQIALSDVLRNVQFHREVNRYVQNLWGDGSLKEVKAMADRVTNIAVRRYQQ